MKKLKKFRCGSCQRQYEELVNDDVKVIDCICKAKAVLMLSAPRFIGNSCGKNASVR